MIRRPPRSTQSRSSAASDVYKRQIQDPVSHDALGQEWQRVHAAIGGEERDRIGGGPEAGPRLGDVIGDEKVDALRPELRGSSVQASGLRGRSWLGSPRRPEAWTELPRSSGRSASTFSSPMTSPRRGPASGPPPTGSRSSPPMAAWTRCHSCPSASWLTGSWICLLYTSDAADDLLCVDLGGRRII